MIEFKLVPFATQDLLPIEISGRIDRQGELLSIEYRLQGQLDETIVPIHTNTPSRKFELWSATCFEFFLGVPGSANYWEFNLSPSGDWNVFGLDDYRQGLRNEVSFTSLPVTIDRSSNSLVLKAKIDLSKIFSIPQDLELSVTTVIESSQHEMSYWALTHTGIEADFHRRDSFVLNI
jgi:hypothetical protein